MPVKVETDGGYPRFGQGSCQGRYGIDALVGKDPVHQDDHWTLVGVWVESRWKGDLVGYGTFRTFDGAFDRDIPVRVSQGDHAKEAHQNQGEEDSRFLHN